MVDLREADYATLDGQDVLQIKLDGVSIWEKNIFPKGRHPVLSCTNHTYIDSSQTSAPTLLKAECPSPSLLFPSNKSWKFEADWRLDLDSFIGVSNLMFGPDNGGYINVSGRKSPDNRFFGLLAGHTKRLGKYQYMRPTGDPTTYHFELKHTQHIPQAYYANYYNKDTGQYENFSFSDVELWGGYYDETIAINARGANRIWFRHMKLTAMDWDCSAPDYVKFDIWSVNGDKPGECYFYDTVSQSYLVNFQTRKIATAINLED